jgi:ankyrin repeat protein
MAPKLVTSQTYVDNIRNFLPEKPNSKTPASEKSKKIFDQIINSPNFIFDKSDKRITDDIKTLTTIRPGRTLFKRLLKADKPLSINFDSRRDSGFEDTSIFLNDSEMYHYSVNLDGEIFFYFTPLFIILAHELIHALHYFEEGREVFLNKTRNINILDPDWDDLEEQETIMGEEGQMTLCENVFCFHFGYPLRINHRGFSGTFTASYCASKGALASLKELLISNPSLLNLPQKYSNRYGEVTATPLNASLAERQVEISDYLFRVGVDVNAQDDHWGTALHVAVQTGQLAVIKMLLDKGADPNVKNHKGFTPLELALLQWENDEAIELLTPLSNLKELDINKWGFSKPFTASDCASNGALASLKELLLSNPSLLNLPQKCTDHLFRKISIVTPLNASLYARQVEISDYLFQVGVDVNAQDEHWGTALHLAVATGQPDLIKTLLKKGADPNVKNHEGFTPLELALLHEGNDEAIELLTALTNLKEIDEQGLSILHRALAIESPERFSALIRHGADINCKDLEGNTPLMCCCGSSALVKCAYSHQKIMILLENDHLDLNAKNLSGQSALSLLLHKEENYNQAYALIKKGAEIPLGLEKQAELCIDLYS